MREPIPLTDEMIDELIKLRRKGMGLRPLGKHFDVAHQTIKNWLVSDAVAPRFSEATGFASGDLVTFKRNIKSGMYRLRAGEEVRIDEIDPAASKAWVSGFCTFDRSVDVPLDCPRTSQKMRKLRTYHRWVHVQIPTLGIRALVGHQNWHKRRVLILLC